MHARVTHARILPGKLKEFIRAVESMVPLIRKQVGFRALVVLRIKETGSPEATIVSVWDSFNDLKASEKNMFFYQALARTMAFCEGFPTVQEHKVLISEFAAD